MFIFIGAAALEYRVAKYHPSEATIHIFLNALRFPLNIFYNDTRYKFFTSQKLSSSDYLKTASLYRSLLSLIVYSIIPFIVLSAYVIGLSQSNDTSKFLNYGFWLIVECISIFRVYRFGHNLPNIEKRRSETEMSRVPSDL